MPRVLYGHSADRWQLSCSECLVALRDFSGSRDEAIAFVTGPPHFWELRYSDVLWCIDCQRKFRAVQPRLTRRSRRSRH